MAQTLENAAGKGTANTALGLGIAGTALALMNNGGLGNILGGNSKDYATKEDLAYVQQLSNKDAEIALLKSEKSTSEKIAALYDNILERINTEVKSQQSWNAQQSVNNAAMSAAIATNASSIASLQNCCNQITKVVIPNESVMPGWGRVAVVPQPPFPFFPPFPQPNGGVENGATATTSSTTNG
jgi:hypothetical protein